MNTVFLIGYVGPGIGMSALGVLLALIGGIFLAILGFIWYPIKRLLKAVRKKRLADQPDPVSK